MPATKPAQKEPELPASARRLRDAQERLLRDNQGDIMVQCGVKTWKCSTVILAQRCKFFKAATSGSFLESETRVVKLNDETIEEVDMLLIHLYTLDDPNFTDRILFRYKYRAAESALKLGDKYDLPDLGAAGQQAVSQILRESLRDWESKTEERKQTWIRRVTRLWTSDFGGVEIVRRVAVEQLATIAKDIVEYEPFQRLCEGHSGFALAFIRAQANIAV